MNLTFKTRKNGAIEIIFSNNFVPFSVGVTKVTRVLTYCCAPVYIHKSPFHGFLHHLDSEANTVTITLNILDFGFWIFNLVTSFELEILFCFSSISSSFT